MPLIPVPGLHGYGAANAPQATTCVQPQALQHSPHPPFFPTPPPSTSVLSSQSLPSKPEPVFNSLSFRCCPSFPHSSHASTQSLGSTDMEQLLPPKPEPVFKFKRKHCSIPPTLYLRALIPVRAFQARARVQVQAQLLCGAGETAGVIEQEPLFIILLSAPLPSVPSSPRVTVSGLCRDGATPPPQARARVQSLGSAEMEQLLPPKPEPVFKFKRNRAAGPGRLLAPAEGEGEGEGRGGKEGGGEGEKKEGEKVGEGEGDRDMKEGGEGEGGEGGKDGEKDGGQGAVQQYGEGVDAAAVEVAEEVIVMVRTKRAGKEVAAWVEEQAVGKVGGDKGRALDVVAQTLLVLGSKSITHAVTVLERYGLALQLLAPDQVSRICVGLWCFRQILLVLGSKSITHAVTVLEGHGLALQLLVPDQASQVQLLHSIWTVWANAPQMAAVVVDRCLGFRLVSPLALLDWCFLPAHYELYHTSERIWEVSASSSSEVKWGGVEWGAVEWSGVLELQHSCILSFTPDSGRTHSLPLQSTQKSSWLGSLSQLIILRTTVAKAANRLRHVSAEVAVLERASAVAAAAASKSRSEWEAATLAEEEAEGEEAKTQAAAKAEWAKVGGVWGAVRIGGDRDEQGANSNMFVFAPSRTWHFSVRRTT
ncbi:unnamed protein product [Closterium sp. NIES-54]